MQLGYGPTLQGRSIPTLDISPIRPDTARQRGSAIRCGADFPAGADAFRPEQRDAAGGFPCRRLQHAAGTEGGRTHPRVAAAGALPQPPAQQLRIEVLETVALKDIAIVRDVIESCRKLGVRFALDDFGTGLQNGSGLYHRPPDVGGESSIHGIRGSHGQKNSLSHSVPSVENCLSRENTGLW
ncbi:MAG TPA: EAL domain-containing protein [Gallionella sp.]|nr:EAL domain-containing protein [Gallionella sp.]